MKKLIRILSLSALVIVAAIGVLYYALPSNQFNISFPQDRTVAHDPGSEEHTHPAAPSLAATPGDEEITISWQTVEGAASYEIWARQGAGPWTQVDGGTLTSTSTSFTHTSLTAGETYFFTAKSVSSDGIKSTWAPQAQATVNADILAPVLTITEGANQITISWEAVTGAATYELWAWETTADWDQLDDGSLSATSYDHTGLTAGLTYHYQMRGLTASGAAGPWSDQAHATVAADLDPPALAATAAAGQVTLTWQTVTGANGYEIWAGQRGGEWQKAHTGSLASTDTSFIHGGLSGGETYYFAGRSVTTSGALGLFGAEVEATVPVSLAAAAITLTPGHARITISWQAVAGADSYELWTWQEGGAWVQLDDGSLTATTYTHSNLTVGSKHYYALRALATDGAEGAWSQYLGAVAAGELPTPVLTATASGTQTTVSWQPVTGADSYELWYWIDGSDWIQLGGGSLTATTFTHTGLTTGTTYYYSLRAHANDGKASAWSENVDATP